MRDVMLANHDLDVDAEIVFMAQDLDDASGGVIASLGKLQDLDVDDHVIHVFNGLDFDRFRHAHTVDVFLGLRDLHAFHDVDPGGQFLVERRDVASMASDMELADNSRMGALEDFDDFPVASAIRVHPANLYDDHVAMHRLRGRLAGDVDVVDEGVAVLVDPQRSYDVFL